MRAFAFSHFRVAIAISFAVLISGTQSIGFANAATQDDQRRVALVVGNSDYEHASRLRNPGNDARDVGAALRRLGFDVTVALDLNQADFATTMSNFRDGIAGADVALFYYSGHALQFRNENYLVSTDATLESEFALSGQTINLKSIVATMESLVPTNLVFLDACRDNPLSSTLQASLRKSDRNAIVTRGLARINAGANDTLISFAAGPGEVADDGAGRNSPYTHAFLKHVARPQTEISTLLKLVARDVRDATDGKQRPQSLADMASLFYFNEEGGSTLAPAAARPVSPAATVSGLLSGVPRAFERPPQNEPGECDRFAADAEDPFSLAPGVALKDIPVEALAICEAAAETDASGRQLYQLGRAREASGDIEAAISDYLESAKAGYATALVALGRGLRDGAGVVRNPKEASEAFRLAARANIRRATTLLGLLHARGEGVRYDPKRAVELYREAVEAGDPIAMNNLAFMLANGRGVDEDQSAAFSLYQQAAELRHPEAAYNLAWMFNDGRGVDADAAEAAKAFVTALRLGSERLHQGLVDGLEYLSDDTLRQLQTELANLGHYRGAIDGQFGRGSQAALRSLIEARN